MMRVDAVRRLWAVRFGRYPSSWAASCTRSSVSLEIRISSVRPLRMYDAVVAETPARAATSVRVGLPDLVPVRDTSTSLTHVALSPGNQAGTGTDNHGNT